MTFVFELRDLKKSLPRPIAHFWQRAAELLCALRIRLALLGLLGFALERPFDAPVVTPSGGPLALLCGVLSAAVSATFGLLCDAGSGLSALFSEDASPLLRLEHRLSLGFGEPMLPFDICPGAGPFPPFSWPSTLALLASAVLLFGGSFRRAESPQYGSER